jgi:hypothetical protein
MVTYRAELTDTFGGDANYCWVNRAEFSLPESATDRQIVMAAKKELGLTGVRCRREDAGFAIILRPVNVLWIVFIDPVI